MPTGNHFSATPPDLFTKRKAMPTLGLHHLILQRTFLQKLISSLESSSPQAPSVQTYSPNIPNFFIPFLFQISTTTQWPAEFPILLSRAISISILTMQRMYLHFVAHILFPRFHSAHHFVDEFYGTDAFVF